MANALFLSPSDLAASGVQRAVYLHPLDQTKVVKTLRPAAQQPRRNNFNGVMDRWFPATRLRQIRKEYTEYLRVMLGHPEAGFRLPISHMFGFVQTNVGLGCLSERVAGPHGGLGETLGDKVKAGSLTDADIGLLNHTISLLFTYGIRASDLNPRNFVFGRRDNGNGPGPKECVLVDGFGDTHAIPVRSMAGWSNRLGLKDSCTRLARNTGLHWDANHQQFSRS